jgi:catechol 2,3-dioxygenase-like lactoylglutathione lyase family enzyme
VFVEGEQPLQGDTPMRQSNPINIRLIDHVVIRVSDLERMIEFYCDVLGCKLERGPGELGLAQLRAGQSLIDLVDAKGPIGQKGGDLPDHKAPNMDHVCLQVQPWDVAAIQQHLQLHNVRTGDVVSRYGAAGSGPSIYINDPEGNCIELKGPASA